MRKGEKLRGQKPRLQLPSWPASAEQQSRDAMGGIALAELGADSHASGSTRLRRVAAGVPPDAPAGVAGRGELRTGKDSRASGECCLAETVETSQPTCRAGRPARPAGGGCYPRRRLPVVDWDLELHFTSSGASTPMMVWRARVLPGLARPTSMNGASAMTAR